MENRKIRYQLDRLPIVLFLACLVVSVVAGSVWEPKKNISNPSFNWKKNENLIILHSRLTFLSEFLLILFTLSFLLLWNKKYCVLPALFHFVTLRLLSIPFKLLNWHCVKVFPSQSSSPSNTSVEIQFWFLTFGYRTSSCTHNHMSVRWKNQVKNESRRDWIFIFTLIVFLSLSLSTLSWWLETCFHWNEKRKSCGKCSFLFFRCCFCYYVWHSWMVCRKVWLDCVCRGWGRI